MYLAVHLLMGPTGRRRVGVMSRYESAAAEEVAVRFQWAVVQHPLVFLFAPMDHIL